MKHHALCAFLLLAPLLSTSSVVAQVDPDPSDDEATGESWEEDADAVADPSASALDESETNPAPLEAEPAPPEVEASAEADGGLVRDSKESTNNTTGAIEIDRTNTDDTSTATPPSATRYGLAHEWELEPYGYARLDVIHDSTQSFPDGVQPLLIARPGTYLGAHGRTTLTARDSRLGIFVRTPDFSGMRSYARIELDFFGSVRSEASEAENYVFGPLRLRHAYLVLETPVVDVLGGQTNDLFGWGGAGFYPATVAYLGLPGQIFHRNPQLRLSKAVDVGDATVEPAVAVVRPAQRDGEIPDLQAGVRIAYRGWKGAAMQGFNLPRAVPLSLGLSAVHRTFELPAYRVVPGMESEGTTALAFAVNALVPIIPAKSATERAWALTLSGEFTTGDGIADLYTGMDGGHRIATIPNPGNLSPAPIYPQNVDHGLVGFDSNYQLEAIHWQAFVVGLQFYLPIDDGRAWISGNYSHVQSNNIKSLTPAPNHGGIFTEMEYWDANAAFAVTPALQVGVSFQTMKQTFGDVTQPEPVYGVPVDPNAPIPQQPGTGGEALTARNNRLQLSMLLAF